MSAIKFGPKDFAGSLPAAADAARRVARADLTTTETNANRASAAVTAAKKRLEDIAAGVSPKEPELKPFLRDTFAKKVEALWKVQSGEWAW